MGLFAYAFAGVGLLLIGAVEAFLSASHSQIPSPPPSPLDRRINKKPPPSRPSPDPGAGKRASSFLTSIAAAILSVLFIANALVSLIDALDSKDRVGSAVQLEVISIASLFLLYAVLGLLLDLKNLLPLPSQIPCLICAFAFVEEFLFFYLQRKDPSGVENRYFDLLLLPIAVCVCSAVLDLRYPNSSIPRLARGVGLVWQGAWFLQMGVSFFTDSMADGCSLHRRSRGNYTVRCKGHPEYHRGRAIATLQFNCLLVLLVVSVVSLFSIVCRRGGRLPGGGITVYRPLGAEMRQMESRARFTLDSDEEDGDEIGRDGMRLMAQNGDSAVSNLGANGYGVHQ